MPPRKSDASKVAAAAVPTGDEGTPVKEKDGINIEVGRHFNSLNIFKILI